MTDALYRLVAASLLCLGGALLAASAHAETIPSLRCGNDFVREGDARFTVIESCGTPLSAEVISSEGSDFKDERLVIRRGSETYFFELRDGKVRSITRRTR